MNNSEVDISGVLHLFFYFARGRTGSCEQENQEKKCGDQDTESQNSSITKEKLHHFLCKSYDVPKNESDHLRCVNNVWTPNATFCVRKYSFTLVSILILLVVRIL